MKPSVLGIHGPWEWTIDSNSGLMAHRDCHTATKARPGPLLLPTLSFSYQPFDYSFCHHSQLPLPSGVLLSPSPASVRRIFVIGSSSFHTCVVVIRWFCLNHG